MKTKAKKQEGKKKNKNNNSKNDTINLDNEIIIGLRPKKEEKKTEKTKKEAPKKKTTKTKNKKKSNNNLKNKKSKKTKKKNTLLKCTSLIAIGFSILVLFLLSDLFNVKEIIVTQNSKVSSESIISLSGIKTGENMFKFLKSKVITNIKTNPYIENVTIKRNLNGNITMEINERVATYCLKLDSKYAYINNQGYILEIVEKPETLTEITGFATENIEPGQRLEIEDLEKLDTVIQIMEEAKNKNIDKIITSINISDESNYVITIESEKKIVYFGDSSNINGKFLYLESLLEETKDEEGEIFLNKKKVIFRKKVSV